MMIKLFVVFYVLISIATFGHAASKRGVIYCELVTSEECRVMRAVAIQAPLWPLYWSYEIGVLIRGLNNDT